jgi:hypothetical protein
MTLLRTLLKAARERLDSPLGRFLLVLSCVLVFSFAFHAKVAIYHQPGHIDGSTASKMWLSGGKLEPETAGPGLMLFWFSTLLLLLLPPLADHYFVRTHAPERVPLSAEFHGSRFQRPPPPTF